MNLPRHNNYKGCCVFLLQICLQALDVITAFHVCPTTSTIPTIKFLTFSSTTDISMESDDFVSTSSSSSSSLGEKRIVLIRHGQTYMNAFIGGGGISYGQPGFTDIFESMEDKNKYIDSPLSEIGRQQAKDLHDSFRRAKIDNNNNNKNVSTTVFLQELDLVVVSPLTRALETFEISLYEHVKDNNIPIVAQPHAAERLYLISDVGKPTSALQLRFPYVDFDTAFNDYPEMVGRKDSWHFTATNDVAKNYVEWRPHGKGQVYACLGEPQDVFDRRMSTLYHWLQSRDEKCIALVCHAGVIEWLTQEIFANCEWRVVYFDSLTPRSLQNNPIEVRKL
jgi:broad specificity phosphatase PhoE